MTIASTVGPVRLRGFVLDYRAVQGSEQRAVPNRRIDVFSADPIIDRVDFVADRVSACPVCCDRCGACSPERIQYGVPGEREHPDEPLGQSYGVGCRVAIAGGRALYVRPNWKPPALHLLLREHRKCFLQGLWLAVFAAFPQEQYELHVVLNYCARLVRLAIEARAVSRRLRYAVRDLVPVDWRKAIEAQSPGSYLNIGMQWNDVVASYFPTRKTDVAYHAANPPAGH